MQERYYIIALYAIKTKLMVMKLVAVLLSTCRFNHVLLLFLVLFQMPQSF